MYTLSDKQINYILKDISSRGVEMVSLQQNLVDHVCCIIEQNLEENGDFENFYQKTIKTFFKDELWEIEEETLSLLIFKNYYTMKKIMILSGMFAATTMLFGVLFKYMHWAGAGTLIPLGILIASLVFLPLFFTLKMKEKENLKDKAILILAALSVTLVCLSFLFRIMHWPFSIEMIYLSALLMLVVFLPVYIVSGIRNEATKTNTIVSSILIIIAYGLLFSMTRTPKGDLLIDLRITEDYRRSQQILKMEERLNAATKNKIVSNSVQKQSAQIHFVCEEAKAIILKSETRSLVINEDLENKNRLITDKAYQNNLECAVKLKKVAQLVNDYNLAVSENKSGELMLIPTKGSFLDTSNEMNELSLRTFELLNQLTQVQMFVLQNERQLMAIK